MAAAGLLLACGMQASASFTSPAIGQPIWSEEFNGASLDTATWTATDGNGCQIKLCGYGNVELEYYSPSRHHGAGPQGRLLAAGRRFAAYRFYWLDKEVRFTVIDHGVGDNYTNQNRVSFPANTTAYGLVRNGDCAQGAIPVSTLIGPKVALQSLLDVFMISSDASKLPASTFQFAIDDIVYDSGTGTTPTPTGPTSVTQTSSTTLQFTTTTGSWADVQHTADNGVQQNVRMRLDGSTAAPIPTPPAA